MADSTGDSPGVAILGGGWGLSVQLPACIEAGMRIVAIWLRSEDKLAAALEQYGDDVAFGSTNVEEVLGRDGVDVAIIATPPATHASLVEAAISAGIKFVWCEKPTALNVTEATAMVKAASSANCQSRIFLGHELRFLAPFARLKDLVAEEWMGPLHSASVVVEVGGRADPRKPFSWWSEASAGGGALGAIGSHFIDLINWILDADEDGATVTASLHTAVSMRPDADGEMHAVTSDDTAQVEVVYASGVRVTFSICTVSAGSKTTTIRLRGANGSVVADAVDAMQSVSIVGHRRVEGERGYSNEDLSVPMGVELTENGPCASAWRIPSMWHQGTLAMARAVAAAASAADADGSTDPLASAASLENGLSTQIFLDRARKVGTRTP